MTENSPLPLRTEDPPPPRGRTGRPKSRAIRALEAAEPGQAFDVPQEDLDRSKTPENYIYTAARRIGKKIAIRKHADGFTVYVTGYRS